MALSKEESEHLAELALYKEKIEDSDIYDHNDTNQILQSALLLIPLDKPSKNTFLPDLLSDIQFRILEKLNCVIALAPNTPNDLMGYAKRELGLFQFRRGDHKDGMISIAAAVDCDDFFAKLFLIRRPLLSALKKLDSTDAFEIWISQHLDAQDTLQAFAAEINKQSSAGHLTNFVRAICVLASTFQSGNAVTCFTAPNMTGLEAVINTHFESLKKIEERCERNEVAPLKPRHNTPSKTTFPTRAFTLGTPPRQSAKRSAVEALIRRNEQTKHQREDVDANIDPSIFSPAHK